jgi:hypothetical protein
MATLTQFVRAPLSRRTALFYICGEVRRGVELVVKRIRETIVPADYRSYYLEFEEFGDAFADLAVASTDTRLVVFRDAERIDAKQWEMIFRWAFRRGNTRLAVVTNEDNPRNGKFPEVFRWFASEGKFVECRQFRTVEQAVEFVSVFLNIPNRYADMVVRKLGVDADILIGELEKAKLAEISLSDLSSVLIGGMPQDLMESLFIRDFRLSLENVDLAQVLGLVELELMRQAAMVSMLEKYQPLHVIAKRVNVPMWAVSKVVERTKATSPLQIARRLELVAKTQHLMRAGANPEHLKAYFIAAWRSR